MPLWPWPFPSLKSAGMHFLKTLLWVVIAVFLAILGSRNWHDVTLNLWGDIQADIKVPVLILFMFLLGWLPTFLLYRAKMWRLRQRLDSQERQATLRVEQPVAEDLPAA
jgi:putative membrane protein